MPDSVNTSYISSTIFFPREWDRNANEEDQEPFVIAFGGKTPSSRNTTSVSKPTRNETSSFSLASLIVNNNFGGEYT